MSTSFTVCLSLGLILNLVSCGTTNSRWGWMLPETASNYKKHTPEGVIFYDPPTYNQPSPRVKWHGGINARNEANGFGVLTLTSEDGSQITDSELGEMQSGRFQGKVYSNHKTGGRAIWRYKDGSKQELLVAWDNKFYPRPSTPGLEARFPPIGAPGYDWKAFARSEQKRREVEAAKEKLEQEIAAREQADTMARGMVALGKLMNGTFIPGSSTAPASNSAVNSASQESEVDRFKGHFRGQESSFTVVGDDGGGFATSNDLVLKDASTGKKFSVAFTYGLGKPLGSDGSMVGRTVIIHFNRDGEPRSIKNPANGRQFDLDTWRASGFGW